MSGTLYITGTPIGNMEDVTFRQLEILNSVDFITAEDTRVTLKLLNRYEIKKPLVSYHEHSTKACTENIIQRIQNGESVAVVSDAGMPCISDPGEELVKECHRLGIDIKVVPGPSAVVSALAISGLDTKRFAFEGFLSTNKKQRYEHLESIKNDRHTLIFYEAPHKLVATLEDMLEYFGNRRISICRELTKIYEQVKLTTLEEALEFYRSNNPKGEFVLVIEGKKEQEKPEITIEDAVSMVRNLIDSGERAVDACKAIAKQTGFRKSELYQQVSKD